MAMHRRTVVKGLAAGIGLAAVKAPMVLAQAAPFKIGLLTVKTGPLAQGGIQMEQGILALLKEKNNTLAGRKIEFISADTGGNPAGAKTKAQELIEHYRMNNDSVVRKFPALERIIDDRIKYDLLCAPTEVMASAVATGLLRAAIDTSDGVLACLEIIGRESDRL